MAKFLSTNFLYIRSINQSYSFQGSIQSILQLQCTHFFNRLQDMPFGGIWCCYIWYGTVLRSQQSMIIHEHDENSWQRLFTVRSLPDAHHPVHGTLGNQDIYDSWNCQLFFEAHKKEFLYKLILVFVILVPAGTKDVVRLPNILSSA